MLMVLVVLWLEFLKMCSSDFLITSSKKKKQNNGQQTLKLISDQIRYINALCDNSSQCFRKNVSYWMVFLENAVEKNKKL